MKRQRADNTANLKDVQAKKIGTVRTRGGLMLTVWRMRNRATCLQHGTQLIFLTPDEAEKLKNLVEKAESGA